MRRRWGRVLLAAVLTLSAYAGRELGVDGGGGGIGVTAQTDGSSGGSEGGSGGGDGGGTGGGNTGGGGGGGADDGSSGGGGSGGGGGGGGGGGTGGGNAGPTTSSTTTTTAAPARPPSEVATGTSEQCPEGTPAETSCYTFTPGDGVEAVRIPNGQGGTVAVDLPADSGADGTSNVGGSTFTSDDPEYRVYVDNRTTNITEVEAEDDGGRQRVLLTIAVLLLVVLAAVLGAVWGRRKGSAAGEPTP